MTDRVPVRVAYDAWATRYDSDDNPTRDLDARALRAADLPLDGAVVVEIGAGTGKNTAYLAGRAHRVIALDFSDQMLARARSRALGNHVSLVRHDITRRWPVANREADVVIGNLVLEHIADIRPVFAEAYRVLRPAGLLYVGELHPFRQLHGGRARYTRDTVEVEIEAYLHLTSEYVAAGLSCGFRLISMTEPGDADDAPGEGMPPLPRLLQLLFARE